MTVARLILIVLVGVLGAACGPKIGDSCNTSIDCAQDGTRVCDSLSPEGGYCTIQGCDYDTCPDNAVCVRFFPGLDSDAPHCTAATELTDCAVDEVCTVGMQCAPRSIEVRYCMASCSGSGDCRDGYECRDTTLQAKHGGEPVPDPNASTATVPDAPFCAAQRTCVLTSQCDPGEACNFDTHTCQPQ